MSALRRKPSRAALTPREREVLARTAAGLGSGEIAAELGVTKRAIAEHIRNLCRKLQARNKLQAVSAAYRKGILTVERRIPKLNWATLQESNAAIEEGDRQMQKSTKPPVDRNDPC
jgi:DNA-binding CsgD family transcriptional regulator